MSRGIEPPTLVVVHRFPDSWVYVSHITGARFGKPPSFLYQKNICKKNVKKDLTQPPNLLQLVILGLGFNLPKENCSDLQLRDLEFVKDWDQLGELGLTSPQSSLDFSGEICRDGQCR